MVSGKNESISKGPIVIEDDVWIGYGSTILSGVTIGHGAVIDAGTIVYKNVPSYAIIENRKVIKYRFSQEQINLLLKYNWCNCSVDFIIESEKNFRV